VLLGAQVAYAHQHFHVFQSERASLADSPAGRERLALDIIFLVGRNFYHGHDPLSVTDLADQLRVPAGLVKGFMELFQQARLVLPLADDETFVLARNPEMISIKEILDCVRHSGKKTQPQVSRTEEENEIDGLLLDVDRSVAETLAGKSLQSLIVSLGPTQARR
jgi:membrane protein